MSFIVVGLLEFLSVLQVELQLKNPKTVFLMQMDRENKNNYKNFKSPNARY